MTLLEIKCSGIITFIRTRLKISLILITLFAVACPQYAQSSQLFGYSEAIRKDLELFPQWLSVLERHIKDSATAGSCSESTFNLCHFERWQQFITGIRDLDPQDQIRRVNTYANKKQYILDLENYGLPDFWATPKEFMYNSGDCEDYAIIKMLSLKKLGHGVNKMRLVILQDTNLRIAHAVLAINYGDDILILDNQVEQVISHIHFPQYAPVYSLNEAHWWIHLPK